MVPYFLANYKTKKLSKGGVAGEARRQILYRVTMWEPGMSRRAMAGVMIAF